MTKRNTTSPKGAVKRPSSQAKRPAASTATAAVEPTLDILEMWAEISGLEPVEVPATDEKVNEAHQVSVEPTDAPRTEVTDGIQEVPPGSGPPEAQAATPDTEDSKSDGSASESPCNQKAGDSNTHEGEAHTKAVESQPVEHSDAGGAPEGSAIALGGDVEEIRAVGDLKPNAVNATVFNSSLTSDGLAELKADLALHGLRYPVEITSAGVILDGERRWRAAASLGWKHVRVVVRHGVENPQDIERYILRAFTTTRDASVEERVGIYQLAREVLARDHGRPAHRPQKGSRRENPFWSKEEVWSEAAKRAGLSSFKVADKATAVFRRASASTKSAVNAGEMSISAAYDALSGASTTKAKRRNKAVATNKADDQVEQTPAGHEGDTSGKATGTQQPTESVAADHEPTNATTDGEEPAKLDDSIADGVSPGGELMLIAKVEQVGGGQSVLTEETVEQGTGSTEPEVDREASLDATREVVSTTTADATVARGLIADLARQADLDVWVALGDHEDVVRELGSRVCAQLGCVAAADYERGLALLDTLGRELREAVAAHAPTEGELD